MPNCPACSASLPNGLSHCRECSSETVWVSFPDQSDWWDDEYAQQLVAESESERITFEKLTTQKSGLLSRLTSPEDLHKHRTADRPIIGYLNHGETPHYLFEGNYSTTLRDRLETRYMRQEQSSTELLPSHGYRPLILVTDQRILAIHSNNETDVLIAAPLDVIVDLEVDYIYSEEDTGGLLNPDTSTFLLKVTTVDSKFEFYIDNSFDRGEINSAVQFI